MEDFEFCSQLFLIIPLFSGSDLQLFLIALGVQDVPKFPLQFTIGFGPYELDCVICL